MTPNHDRPRGAFRADINALRALAVGLVVCFHFGLPGAGGGYVGVDIFFVISGYLMTGIIMRRSGQRHFLWTFYLARVTRIVPALFVMVAGTVAVCWWVLNPIDYRQLAEHALASLLFVSNIVYAREAGYFDQAAHAKWLLHTWSLSVEWQFYLLIPIFLLVLRRLFGTGRALAGAVGLVTIGLYVSSGLSAEQRPMQDFYSLTSRAWELLAGGMVYWAANDHRPVIRRGCLVIAGIALIALGVVVAGQKPAWPGWLALVPVAGTALVIAAAHQGAWTTNVVVGWIGSRSYSIYLWHWPIVVYLSLAERLSDPLAAGLGLVATLALAEASYRFVETPIQARAATRTVRVVLATLVMAAGMGAAWLIYADDGIEQRFGSDAQELHQLASIAGDWGFPSGEIHDGRISADLPAASAEAPVVAVLGDSHAEHLYPRFAAQEARPARLIFLTRGGCLPIPGYDRVDQPNQCGAFADEAWEQVLQIKPARLVVAAQWINYFLDSLWNSAPISCVRTRPGNCDTVVDEKTRKALFDRLGEKIQQAKASGIQVVLIGPVPFTQQSYVMLRTRNIAAAHLPLNPAPATGFDLLEGSIATGDFVTRVEPITSQLARISQQAGAEYVDPVQFMCQGGRCPLVGSDGSPLYKDGSHLRPVTVRGDAMGWLDSVLFGD